MTGGGFRSFTAGEVLTAANVQDFLMDQAVMNFNGTAARGSALPSPSAGMMAHVGGGTATIYNGSAWVRLLPETGGKILQIVRATDSTDRTTTSTSFVDASISVTITPTLASSAVLLVWSFYGYKQTSNYSRYQITNSGNTAVSGAEGGFSGIGTAGGMDYMNTLIAYATPATTSAVTYKGRFLSVNGVGVAALANATQTGQLYAIEVSA